MLVVAQLVLFEGAYNESGMSFEAWQAQSETILNLSLRARGERWVSPCGDGNP
jgi:hypothetical protein